MKLLSIDPSSSCCGYAAFVNDEVRDAGRVKPARATDQVNDRIRAMLAELLKLVAEARPDVIVIEDTSGKVGRRRHGGGGAGLAVYGKAVGWIIAAMERTGIRVVLVLENEWTRRQTKAQRVRFAAAICAGYDPRQDPGGDVADAIGVGRWWIDQNRLADAAGGVDRATSGRVWPPQSVRQRRRRRDVQASTD